MKLTKGSILYTKDGRKIGNGIITDVLDMPILGTMYRIKTDFGNIKTYFENEIDELFYISKLAYIDPLDQVREQINLLDKNFPDFV